MGSQYQATCRLCGHEFTFDEGGGMRFEQLRCEKCGRETTVPIDENDDSKPRSRAEWRNLMETKAKKCRCGGKFKLGAPARCPKCRSLELDKEETGMLYD